MRTAPPRGGVVSIHSPATIKSLLKNGLLEGNSRGEKITLVSWDGIPNFQFCRPRNTTFVLDNAIKGDS